MTKINQRVYTPRGQFATIIRTLNPWEVVVKFDDGIIQRYSVNVVFYTLREWSYQNKNTYTKLKLKLIDFMILGQWSIGSIRILLNILMIGTTVCLLIWLSHSFSRINRMLFTLCWFGTNLNENWYKNFW